MVANTLEEMDTCAFLGPVHGGYERVNRADLPRRLLEEVEREATSPRKSPTARPIVI